MFFYSSFSLESPPPPYCLIPAERSAMNCEGKQFLKRRLVVVDSPASGYYYTRMCRCGHSIQYAHIIYIYVFLLMLVLYYILY